MTASPPSRFDADWAALPPQARAVLEFWFGPCSDPSFGQRRAAWFQKNDAFDAQIRAEFGDLIERAQRDELGPWPAPWGTLAQLIVLDQFSRNVFRGSARAFAGDALALALAQHAVAAGIDVQLPPVPRCFVYLPFEHSEALAVQDESVRLFRVLSTIDASCAVELDYAERHRTVIARFGRFPHRNAALSRASTPEETAFLREPGSRF